MKDPFRSAVSEHGNNAFLVMGPKGGTHIWQPVDHNVGVRYRMQMNEYYDEWISSPEAEEYMNSPSGNVPVDVRRTLLVLWAKRAYDALEEERKSAENKGEKSTFFKAFESTGCMVTNDVKHGEDEHISQTVVEDAFRLSADYDAQTCKRFCDSLKKQGKSVAKKPVEDSFIIELSSSDDDGTDVEVEEEHKAPNNASDGDSDSEDADDEPQDSDGDVESVDDDVDIDELEEFRGEILRDWKASDELSNALFGSASAAKAKSKPAGVGVLVSKAQEDAYNKSQMLKIGGKRKRNPSAALMYAAAVGPQSKPPKAPKAPMAKAPKAPKRKPRAKEQKTPKAGNNKDKKTRKMI